MGVLVEHAKKVEADFKDGIGKMKAHLDEFEKKLEAEEKAEPEPPVEGAAL